VANPPFSSKNWGHERFKKSGDPYGRIKHLPPKSHGEMAFVQHMIASLDDEGMLAVVLPNGCFFRGGPELAVRRELVEADLVEAIVQLPVDLFYGAGIPACILVCNKAKAIERKHRVLMVDASSLFERRDTKNVFSDVGIKQVAQTFSSGSDVTGFAAWAARDEIVSHSYNLTVRRYVAVRDASANGDGLSLDDAVAAYRVARVVREEAEKQLDAILASLDEV
jgi:type I restriction enzyme M protein